MHNFFNLKSGNSFECFDKELHFVAKLKELMRVPNLVILLQKLTEGKMLKFIIINFT